MCGGGACRADAERLIFVVLKSKMRSTTIGGFIFLEMPVKAGETIENLGITETNTDPAIVLRKALFQ